jgi:integrase
MTTRLTPKVIATLPLPPVGKAWLAVYDTEVSGFGVRTMKSGAQSYVLRYRVNGIERLITIGDVKDWTLKDARVEARRLRQMVDRGIDPQAKRQAELDAPTIGDAIVRWRKERVPRMRPRSAKEAEGLIRQHIEPKLGDRKIAGLTHADADRFFLGLGDKTPARANRTIELLSRLCRLAIRWGWLNRNPCEGIEKHSEHPRHRYLSNGELARLLSVLGTYPARQPARLIQFLLASGARFGEVAGMRWEQLHELDGLTPVWVKPPATVKQDKIHRVPLNQAACALLREIHTERAGLLSPFVFPAPQGRGRVPVRDVDHHWRLIRKAAGLSDFRLHDLRHSFASFLVSAGYNLPMVGALLGHSQAATTQRYAHLMDTAQRAASETLGALISLK